MKTSPLRRSALLLWLGLAPLFALAAENAAFFSALPFDAAREKAATEHKIVFIDFYTTWCGPCKELDATTWQAPAVVALLSEKAISLKIDAEMERDLAERYHVDAYPTLLLLKPDGTEIDRIVGYREPAKFMEEFNAALAGKTALVRARAAATDAANDRERVQARYRLGQELSRAGQCEAALAEFLWCYDEGMAKSPLFVGVRLSYLLLSIDNLGQQYPPAHAALRQRRADALARAQLPEAKQLELAELVALNRTLRDEGESLKFYDALPDGDSRKAQLAWPLFDQLLSARRYTDIAAGLSFAQASSRLEEYSRLPANGSARIAELNRDFARETFANFIEVFAGAGDVEHAKTLIERAVAFDASPDARRLYRASLARAGQPDLLPE